MEKLDGFIITESAYSAKPKIVSDKADVTVVETILQEAEADNRNKRRYDRGGLFGALKTPQIQEKLKRKTFYGEAGHPLASDDHDADLRRQTYIDQTRISHIITDLKFEGNLVKGMVESANTACGKDFQGLIRQGSEVSFSMRGIGGAAKRRGDITLIEGPLMIICYDWVVFPSHANAYMEKIIQESAQVNEKILTEGKITPANMNELFSYIAESSKNVQELAEAAGFEIKKDGSNLFVAKDKMLSIREGGDILKVKLEDFVSTELDEYMRLF